MNKRTTTKTIEEVTPQTQAEPQTQDTQREPIAKTPSKVPALVCLCGGYTREVPGCTTFMTDEEITLGGGNCLINGYHVFRCPKE